VTFEIMADLSFPFQAWMRGDELPFAEGQSRQGEIRQILRRLHVSDLSDL
jgi:hypothetical protein